jgi:hypothetical protein
MTTEKQRNRFLRPGWEVYVNEGYVSELEAQAIKFADQLERRALDLRARGFADENGTVQLHMLVTPGQTIIARALQIMVARGFSITGGDKAPGACAADFSVLRTTKLPQR